MSNVRRHEIQSLMKRASRILLTLVVLFGLGWLYSIYRGNEKKATQQEAGAQRQHALATAVATMASRFVATTDWAANLAGTKLTRTSPILTAELQELWTPDHPILFVARVRDIVRNPDMSYQLELDYDFLRDQHMLVGTELRLSLRCPNSLAQPLLAAMKSHTRSISDAEVAAIAVVESIASSSERDSEGTVASILTGVGRCLDLQYLSERLPR